jgi:hypothetical protein
MLRSSNKTAQERGTVPFCSEDSAKLGQSPAVLFEFLSAQTIISSSVLDSRDVDFLHP